jgi:ribonucleoside-diphosphate reductase alpha chain
MEFSQFAETIYKQKYAHTKPDGTKETWEEIADRVARHVCLSDVSYERVDYPTFDGIRELIKQRKFMPGGRYLYAAGRPFHQTQNCLLLRAEDSREGWADLLHKASMALMTGAGIGVDYSAVRAEGSHISRTGGKATGPLALMQMVNEAGRHIMQGGARRSAIWAGLNWAHPDILDFINIKDWSPEVRRLKEHDFNFPATLDGTNISVILDRAFFGAYAAGDEHANKVYWATVRNMLSTAEPGFSVDYDNARESLRNACTEITSEDDSDICNLGSLNLARFDSLVEFKAAVELATTFLLAGTLYSDVPYDLVGQVRTQNRRLGLGIMGIHEWLLKRGKKYGEDAELAEWLEAYRTISTETANRVADAWGISRPIKTRAIAPTGTIGIVAETTTGLEPIFCVAYRRRYKGDDGHTTKYQYVIDPTAKRLIDSGVSPELIEDAYTLAEEPERRVAFQAWVQQYVDHAISSTINLPPGGSDLNNENTVRQFGDMLLQYLPKLRGITCYPDGCRGGQPLTRVSYETAVSKVGQVFEEAGDICEISGKGGSCGA